MHISCCCPCTHTHTQMQNPGQEQSEKLQNKSVSKPICSPTPRCVTSTPIYQNGSFTNMAKHTRTEWSNAIPSGNNLLKPLQGTTRYGSYGEDYDQTLSHFVSLYLPPSLSHMHAHAHNHSRTWPNLKHDILTAQAISEMQFNLQNPHSMVTYR